MRFPQIQFSQKWHVLRMAALTAVSAALMLGSACHPAHAGEGEPGDEHSGRSPGLQDFVSRAGDESNRSPTSFITLCYHDVEDRDPDQRDDAVSTDKLIQQLSWLQQNGYNFISLDDVLAAHAGTRPLPRKPILLTFDDGYESYYTRVYPILKAFNFPSIIGIVKEWMDGPINGRVAYGPGTRARRDFLTWDQLREMQRSGLVEILAHTGYMHRGIVANPQGNTEPAAVTRRYKPVTRSYETEAAYQQRISLDARAISDVIKQQTGRRPRGIIWPYGEYSTEAVTLYAGQGMPITFSLADGVGQVQNLDATPRLLVVNNPSVGDFAPDVLHISQTGIVRVAHIDLDYVYDPDPAQMDSNLGRLVQRIFDLDINVVYLQAFADPTGSGTVNQVYFPNHLLPMRADLFNRVSWQLRTRAGVRVYAWMPVLSYDFGKQQPSMVQTWNPKTKTAAVATDQYRRLSPYDPKARALIGSLYEDLAKASPIAGILFHDDAELSDFEDASPLALQAYKNAGLPATIDAIRSSSQAMQRWTAFKTKTLVDFTLELAAKVRNYRSPLRTARNIYSLPILQPASEEWMAQNFDSFINAYDYTAIEAMPLMEGVPAAKANDWLTKLVNKVKSHPGALAKTVFELQAVDWRKPDNSPARVVTAKTLVDEMQTIQRLGALNYGYYPDDFVNNQPDVKVLHAGISLQAYEYRK